MPCFAVVFGVANGALAGLFLLGVPNLGGEDEHALAGANAAAGTGEDEGPFILLDLLGHVYDVAPGLAIVITVHHFPLAGLGGVCTGGGAANAGAAVKVAGQCLHPNAAGGGILQNAGVTAAVSITGAGIHVDGGQAPGLAAVLRAHHGYVNVITEVLLIAVAGIKTANECALLRANHARNTEAGALAGLATAHGIHHLLIRHGEEVTDTLLHTRCFLCAALAINADTQVGKSDLSPHLSSGRGGGIHPQHIFAGLQGSLALKTHGSFGIGFPLAQHHTVAE